MEDQRKLDDKENKIEQTDEKETILNYKIDSCIFGIKDIIEGNLDELNINNSQYLNELERLDNTNQKVIFEKLKLKPSKKLLFQNFDILNKSQISEFNIIKKYSNDETYFYFLDYIINVKIIKSKKEFKTTKKEEKKKIKKLKNPSFQIDFSNGNIKIKNIKINDNNDCAEKYTEDDYERMVQSKNIIIDEYFIMKEEITVKNLREKIKKFYKKMKFGNESKNNFPNFESELFFYYQLINVLGAFKELDDEDFLNKIDFINSIEDFIDKVKKKEIRDRVVLTYFYFIIDVEYDLELGLLFLINDYEEKDIYYEDAYIDKSENKLYINNSDIVIDNFNYYRLNQDDIKKIREGKLKLPLKKQKYSLKGYILQREFTSKEGNIIYEKFLKSNLAKNILSLLYGPNTNSMTSLVAIQLLQKNTYYFPINNPEYTAYTDKYCFKVYIDYNIDEIKSFTNIKLCYSFKHLIRKAFFIVNILHEYGHIHKPLLSYIYSDNSLFHSPYVEIKTSTEKEVIKEGGKLFEYLLFGRIINQLNIKEVIYICNLNNFSKSLDNYRNDFLNLKNESLLTVFERESKDNQEIEEIYKEYNNLSEDEKMILEKQTFKTAKRNNDENIKDLEEIYFKCSKRNKSHTKFREDFDSD